MDKTIQVRITESLIERLDAVVRGKNKRPGLQWTRSAVVREALDVYLQQAGESEP